MTSTTETANPSSFKQAPLWDEQDFVPGRVQTAISFWENTILADHPERGQLLRWLQGVHLNEFVNHDATGIFQHRKYEGNNLTAIELPNHVPPEFDDWVSGEISKLQGKGCIMPWSTLADSTSSPRPHICQPLEVEPRKPRLFWDGRWLNLMCKHSPFHMDGVGKVAQSSWKGAYQVTLDQKSGFHHIPLDPSSWTHFGLCWKGVYYVGTVLCFGWCSSPYIYHTLSEAVAQYLRGKGIPVLAWLDDFWLTNESATQYESSEDQAQAAHSTTCLALTVFYKCGYFMSLFKCTLASSTCLIYLGVICDSHARRFEVPADKLDKLEALLRHAINHAWISFVNLGKLAGKCTSMNVAVPPASLYTYNVYRQIESFRRTGRSSILARVNVPPNEGLRYEMDQWLSVRKRMNGASWYNPAHHSIAITGATDASSQGWGGVVGSPRVSADVLRAAADFPPDLAQAHINIKETFALHKVLRLRVDDQPEYLRGSTATIDVGNTTMFHSVRNGRAKDARMHHLVCQLFWFQVEADFTLKLRWVSSKDNAVADALTRPEASEHVRLGQKAFDRLWHEWRGSDMDLMATSASSQRPPISGGGEETPCHSIQDIAPPAAPGSIC